MMNDVKSWGRNFLEATDNFLKKNYPTLRCKDIYDIYFQVLDDLKNLKGNSIHFDGLSELLIFRVLYHQLGGSFRPVKVGENLFAFEKENIRIEQAKSVFSNIVVYHSNKLVAAAYIEQYFYEGSIDQEMSLLEASKRLHPDLKALLLIYDIETKGGLLRLQSEKRKFEWFDFLILKDNEELLAEKLQTSLGLDRLKE